MFKKKALNNVVWEITLECNARCLHCGSAAGAVRTNELSTEEALDLCDQLGEIACERVNLIGGELFLRPDWKELLKRLTDYNMEVSIVTNGITLTEDKVDFLASIKINTVGISLDGGTPETNDYIRQVPGLFDKIFNIIEYIDKVNLGAVAITTLNKLNIHELAILREKLINSPFKAWQIQIAATHGSIV